MVRVTEELALSPEHVTLFSANDPLLGHLPVLIFHGPSTTANYTHNSSRVQIHVLSAAGFQSFPRVTISPNSPYYGVVHHLPRDFQGDEICRALAFGIYKYFKDLPEAVKSHLKHSYPSTRGRRPGSTPALFGEQHAADLAKAMVQADNTADVIRILEVALQTQHISNVDVDLVLPPGSIVPLQNADLEEVPDDEDDILDPTLRQYGLYNPLVKLFGEPVFMPTSRLRRAPSKPSSLNRSKSFNKDQKVDLRLKMGELVDTEERYVLKLAELVHHVADDFRQCARQRSAGSISPNEDDINRLFPESADRILQINSAFMQELRRVMDESEEDALRDMEIPFAATTTTSQRFGGGGGGGGGGSTRAKDPSGALALARVFVEWFPRFTDCYQDYIRASQNFPALLNSFLEKQSSFRQRVVQKGEQTIRSILIEPVQRLPRYNLFIDQIVSCLPITHPALQLMLRARDIITNICSMDDPLPDKPHVVNRLRTMVECWPPDLEPQARLIHAVDVVELAAPYVSVPGPHGVDMQDRTGLLLLFADCVVILKKKVGAAQLTSRDLLREIDKPSPAGLLAAMTNAAGGPGSWEFAFTGWHSLADVRFTESSDGRLVWMTSTAEMKGAHAGEYVTSKAITSRCFLLQESYEARATRWGEDVVKARVEGRFPEREREDPGWTLRSVRMEDSGLGMHAAVFQEGADQLMEGRREPAGIRIVVDNDRGTKGAPVGHYGVEVVVEISSGSMRRISMNTVGVSGRKFTDDVALEDLLPTLSRRIIQLLSTQFSGVNPRLVPALVSYCTKILRGLSIAPKVEKNKSSFLASSPVKLLSNFLAGSSSTLGTDSILNGPRLQRTPVTSLFPPAVSRSPSLKDVASLSGSLNNRHGSGLGAINGIDDDRRPPENPLMRLEQTFTGYVASLQARQGYFIGRSLLSRAGADELQVNDLYNRLIESPFDLDASAELSAEVIFAAFEKFVRIAWREQMGPVMTTQALDALQVRASKKVPGDFADFVNFLFSDMAPQNRRAFTAMVKLLANLLDGCGNDGDRGALTLAFAELLVDDEQKAPNYINLLDRLVEDCDRIFDDGGGSGGGGGGGSGGNSIHFKGSSSAAYDSVSIHSISRSHKSASGSMTSNTSSLRRKFGFDTLLRQNSKSSSNDHDRPSMWRSLSKHGRNPATGEPSSFSKGSVNRSRSIDLGAHHTGGGGGGSGGGGGGGPNRLLRRPVSRDRPPVTGAFDDVPHRPGSSHRTLETIGEPEDVEQHYHHEQSESRFARKKRRSSLSDLKALMAAASLDEAADATTTIVVELETGVVAAAERPPLTPTAPLMPLRINRQQTAEKFNSINASPRILAAVSKIPVSPPTSQTTAGGGRGERPQSMTVRASSTRQKENISQVFSQSHHSRVPSTMSLQPHHPAKNSSRDNNSSSNNNNNNNNNNNDPLSPEIIINRSVGGGRAHCKTLSGSSIPSIKTSRLPTGGTPTDNNNNNNSPAPTHPTATTGGRSGSGSPTKSGSASPTKLRLQSTQKLRERLQNEKKAAEEVDASLRSELSRITEEMARLNKGLPGDIESAIKSPLPHNNSNNNNNKRMSRSGAGGISGSQRSKDDPTLDSTTATNTPPTVTTPPSPIDISSLAAAVRALEERLPRALRDMQDRQAEARREADAALAAAEQKVRAIDQLYKEATAENELLYERFNGELAKIVRALKGKKKEGSSGSGSGGGGDEKDENHKDNNSNNNNSKDKDRDAGLLARVKEATEETARVKKENARLRREMISLRALMKGEKE